MILKKGDKLVCPWCDAEQECPVEDAVIPGKVGIASIGGNERCNDCDKWVSVEYLGNNKYDVTEASGEE